MSNIISFFQKLIRGGVGIRAGGGLENFSKINKRRGTIIRCSRVVKEFLTIFLSFFRLHLFSVSCYSEVT